MKAHSILTRISLMAILAVAILFSCTRNKQNLSLLEKDKAEQKTALKNEEAPLKTIEEVVVSEEKAGAAMDEIVTKDKAEDEKKAIGEEDGETIHRGVEIVSYKATPTGASTMTLDATSTGASSMSWTSPSTEGIRISGEMMEAPSVAYYTYTPVVPGATAATSAAPPVDASLAGKLTAGEINDFKKWKMWEDLSEGELTAYRAIWKMDPSERYTVLVQTESGAPVVDCIAELVSKTGEVIWKTKTDNTGKAELWGKIQSGKESESAGKVDKIVVEQGAKEYKIERPKTFEKSINTIKIPVSCSIPDAVDICFTVDATGSMGDEIAYLQAELLDVIGKIKSTHKDIELQLGSVFYRDHGDTYVTRTSDFSKDVNVTNRFISEQYADGGGDGPEAVDDALQTSLNEMSWSNEARARILFMILDAPPHQEAANLQKLDKSVREAAAKGVRIIPLVASGGGYDLDKSLEYLMRCCALSTNGTYAFLTNHSGIGGHHTAPSTDHYDVETLNKLLLRIVGEYLLVPDCNVQTFVDNQEVQDTINAIALIEPEMTDSLSASSDTTALHIEDPKEIVVISCYPNPASDYVWIKTSADVNELYLADNSGKLMQKIIPNSSLFQLDLTFYPSGIYYVKAWINDEWVSARIVVARLR